MNKILSGNKGALINKIGQERYDFLLLINPWADEPMTIPEACKQMGVHPSTGNRWLDAISRHVPGLKGKIRRVQAINSQLNSLDNSVKYAEHGVGITIDSVPSFVSLDKLNDEMGGVMDNDGNMDYIKETF